MHIMFALRAAFTGLGKGTCIQAGSAAATTACPSTGPRLPLAAVSAVCTPRRALQTGLVGLPNVGKSTLFNAMLGRAAAEASNFPFCTLCHLRPVETA